MRIRKQFRFEAAHVLPFHSGKCARLHGHSYRLDVTLRGPLQADGPAHGMVLDFDDLSSTVKLEVIDRLDHCLLNDIVDNPTCERVITYIWRSLVPRLPLLDELTLWETATACATLRAEDLAAPL